MLQTYLETFEITFDKLVHGKKMQFLWLCSLFCLLSPLSPELDHVKVAQKNWPNLVLNGEKNYKITFRMMAIKSTCHSHTCLFEVFNFFISFYILSEALRIKMDIEEFPMGSQFPSHFTQVHLLLFLPSLVLLQVGEKNSEIQLFRSVFSHSLLTPFC